MSRERLLALVILNLGQVSGPDAKGWYTGLCPYHDDRNRPNLRVNERGYRCMACGESGNLKKLASRMGLVMNCSKTRKKGRTVVSLYDYCKEDGILLYQVVRYQPKDFKQRRPDGNGGWLWNLQDVLRVLYRLPELIAAPIDVTVYIPEGEKDCDALCELGLTATCNSGGSNKFTKDLREPLKDRHVVIIADKDEPGRRHAQNVARLLSGFAATVKIIEVPGDKSNDVTDWLNSGGTRDQLGSLVEEAAEYTPEPENGDSQSGLPRILVSNRHLREISEDAWTAILAANEPPVLFQHGHSLVDIVHDNRGQPLLRTLDKAALKGFLDRIADFESIDSEGRTRPARPPNDVVSDMMAASQMPVPVIEGIIEAPVFGPAGALCTSIGYQPETKCYLVLKEGISIPEVSEHPSVDAVMKARSLLIEELLGDFPFLDNADLAHAIAVIILPFVRPLINGPSPLHLVESPMPASGKGLLVDVLGIPATGRSPAIMAEGRDEDEWRKRITAKLVRAPQFVVIDNVRSRLDSAMLSAALTSTAWEDRILGQTATVVISVSCVWLATANNPSLSLEVARRTVSIRLDAETEKPWLRTSFRHSNLRRWAREHRGELIWAALTLGQAWVDAGMPEGGGVLGSYEEYAAVIGGILDVAEIPGFLQNQDRVYAEAQSEVGDWEQFFHVWWAEFHDQNVGTEELFNLARSHKLLLDIWSGRNDHSARTKFGLALSKMRDRVIDKMRMCESKADTHTKASQYRLEVIDLRRVRSVAGGLAPNIFLEPGDNFKDINTIRKNGYVSEAAADKEFFGEEKVPQPSATLRSVDALEAENDMGEV